MKSAVITLDKSLILYDIDARTFKRVDSNLPDQPDRTQNAISSDSEEELDKKILHRYMQGRDATLRKILAFAIMGEEVLTASNGIKDSEPSFVYNLSVPDGFRGLDALAQKMHRFIVDGSIHDWYRMHATTSPFSEGYFEDAESSIICTLRAGYASRPLQPFGPRK